MGKNMTFRELLCQAQFHGSRRVAERSFRIWWILALGFCLWAATSIVLVTVTRFLQNPAYLALTESSEISMPFPSIVLCPELVFPEDKIDNFLDNVDFPPGVERSVIKPVIGELAAFYSPDVPYSINNLKLIEQLLDYNALTVQVVGELLTASCEESLLRCRLFGIMKNCSSLFTMELTNYGFCCVFNGRSLRKELQLPSDLREKPHELMITEAGPLQSLMFVVNNSQHMTDIDLTYKWIYLESGLQYVETGGNGTAISPETEMWFGYDTKQFYIATDDYHSMNTELRTCRPSNAKLKYFPYYSKRFCMLECQMEHTLDRCGCLRTNHPRPFVVPYCRATSQLCVQNSAVTSSMCDCPVTCDSSVDLTVVQTYPLLVDNSTADYFYYDLDFSKVTIVRAYLLRHETKLYSRRPFYTAEDLFSQIGGLFSVFFGCSVFTLLEMVQLFWHSYLEYKTLKILNRKPELIFPPTPDGKKNTFKKIVDKDKVVILQAW